MGQHLVDASPTEVTYSLKVREPCGKSDLSDPNTNELKTIPIGGIIWITANTLIKASILHFYNTVFGINRAFRYTTYVVAAVVVSFGISTVLQEVLLCRPFAKNWNSHLPGVCGSSSATILAEAIINMLIDIAIILMPMPLVWGLQMTRRRKIVFTIVVGLGLMYVCPSLSVRLMTVILTHAAAIKHLCDHHPSDRIRSPVRRPRHHVRLLQSLGNNGARARTGNHSRLSTHVPVRLQQGTCGR